MQRFVYWDVWFVMAAILQGRFVISPFHLWKLTLSQVNGFVLWIFYPLPTASWSEGL